MNELRRSGKRTREQLTFSDTYLVLDNLREYDFDLVSFYVTFTQYIDRRAYEGRADNSLIFANNEALFTAFNISRNKFYRLLKLSYECGLIDIEKGDSNRNIYILNDAVPFEKLEKIRNWEDRNKLIGKDKNMDLIDEKNNKKDVNKEDGGNKKESEDEKNNNSNKEKSARKYRKMSHPKSGQPKQGQPVVPKEDNPSSQIGTTSQPKQGQLSTKGKDSNTNDLDGQRISPNNSKGLIDLSFNISKSISQSIDNNIYNKKDGQTDFKKELEKEYTKTIDACEINHIEEDYGSPVARAIYLIYQDIEKKKTIKIGENLIPSKIIRNDLKKLNFLVVQHAINKFKTAAREKEIRNTIAYLKSCIYNSIHEMEVDIDAELRYQGLI